MGTLEWGLQHEDSSCEACRTSVIHIRYYEDLLLTHPVLNVVDINGHVCGLGIVYDTVRALLGGVLSHTCFHWFWTRLIVEETNENDRSQQPLCPLLMWIVCWVGWSSHLLSGRYTVLVPKAWGPTFTQGPPYPVVQLARVYLRVGS